MSKLHTRFNAFVELLSALAWSVFVDAACDSGLFFSRHAPVNLPGLNVKLGLQACAGIQQQWVCLASDTKYIYSKL